MRQSILLILIFLTACTKEIEIEQVVYSPKIVVDGWIENDNYAKVYITRSSPYLSDYASTSIMETFINHAKVSITDSDGNSEILTLFRESNIFPPFVYKTVRLKGNIGKEYHLTIEVENKVIQAKTSIPSPPDVVSLSATSLSDSTYIINSIVSPPKGISCYYSQTKILHENEQIHASAIPLVKIKNSNNSLYWFNILRKLEPDPLHLKPEIPDSLRISRPVHEYLNSDTVLVKISTIDEESFNILNALYIDQLNNNNPFSFTNEGTATNIEGGIGHWTGLASHQQIVSHDSTPTAD